MGIRQPDLSPQLVLFPLAFFSPPRQVVQAQREQQRQQMRQMQMNRMRTRMVPPHLRNEILLVLRANRTVSSGTCDELLRA